MSKMRANTETGDVLTSIRRLVADPTTEAPKTHARTDRLILTPAQRVDQPLVLETPVQQELKRRRAELEASITELEEAMKPAAPAPAPGLINDDVLRNLVRDVIRDEFAGEMGDKVSANVRRMVRREIYKVLASEDYS